MSFNDRIQAALAVIEEHNQVLADPNQPGYSKESYESDRIDSEQFVRALKKIGGTSEERLAQLSHEDILECFADHAIKPRLLAKAIAKIFRDKMENSESPVRISAKKADKMSIRELVENFDPENATNPIGVRLAEIAKNQKFIVYSAGRAVDVEATYKLLNEVKQGFKGREDYQIGDTIFRVYALGELPDNYVDENPLYPGRPLRPDGTCDQTGRSYEGVSMEVRQFIRVAINIGEIIVNHEMAHNIMDMAMNPNAMANLQTRYRKTAVKFNELKKTGTLPKLIVALSPTGESKSFPKGEKVMWAAYRTPQVEARIQWRK